MSRSVRALGIVAASLGAAALFAGSPYRARADGDEITAPQLAEWIRERKAGLRVLDVRTAREFDEYHVPTAERVAVDSIATVAPSPNATLVVYAVDAVNARDAARRLRANGNEQILILRNGVGGWLADVMNPLLPARMSSSDSVRFAALAELSRYFGGQPLRAGERPDDDQSPRTASEKAADLMARTRRRGC